MAAKVSYSHDIRPPVEYSLVEKRVLVDEVGRARDPATGAIVNIGRRERLPLASEDQYARQVAQKEDYAAEVRELRAQVSGLKSSLTASQRRVSDLESNQGPLLEEIAYLRSVTGTIYEKHRIDAYHNLGLGMQNQRLESEVHGLRCQSERNASGLAQLGGVETVQDNERIHMLEDHITQLNQQAADMATPGFDFGERVYQCEIDPPGVGYRDSPLFADKNSDGTGPQKPEIIVADRIVQGKNAVFVRDKRNGLWCPISDPTGTKVCLRHLGKATDELISQHELCVGNVKVKKQGAWFQGKLN